MGEEDDELALIAAAAHSNQGSTYLRLQQFDDALRSFERCLKIQERILGTMHPDTALSFANISLTRMQLHEPEPALKWARRALDVQTKTLGLEHPSVANTHRNMALAHLRLQEYERAIPLLYRAIEIEEKKIGERSDVTASSYFNLGLAFEAVGKPDEAERWFAKTEAAVLASVGERSLFLVRIARRRAVAAIGRQDFGSARALLNDALALARDIFGPQHSELGGIHRDYGLLELSLDRPAAALTHFAQALAIVTAVRGPDHPEVARATFDLARVSMVRRDLRRLAELLEAVRSIEVNAGRETSELARESTRLLETLPRGKRK